jgi:hypothetical protein
MTDLPNTQFSGLEIQGSCKSHTHYKLPRPQKKRKVKILFLHKIIAADAYDVTASYILPIAVYLDCSQLILTILNLII